MSGALQILIFVFLLLSIASVLLMQSTRKKSGFQARLSILFFLFVIIPLLPLAIIFGQVFNKGSETLIVPGVEEALNLSLRQLRLQLNEHGQLLLTEYQKNSTVPSSSLNTVYYAGKIVRQNQKTHIVSTTIFSEWNDIPKSHILDSDISSIMQRCELGEIVRHNNIELFESYIMHPDSSFSFLAFKIPKDALQTKESITEALRNYNSILLLRDAMLEKDFIWVLLLFFILLLAIISIFLSRYISRGVSEPIQELTKGMKKVAAGDLKHKISIHAKDEIAFLVDSFNNMTEEMRITQSNLQRAERAAAWRDIARQISHEIKNPLTPIEFSLYRLESSLPEDSQNNADIAESIRIIREEISSIRRITSEFSQFAKMPHVELKPSNITSIIKDSIHLFDSDDQAHIAFSLKADEALPSINLDEEQMKRVFHNLLKNAIEASKPGDSIKITVTPSQFNDKVNISIADSGTGMDEATLSRIWEPYFTTKTQGSGIGMFMVQRIINDHGGKIDVQSIEGKGTTVRITI